MAKRHVHPAVAYNASWCKKWVRIYTIIALTVTHCYYTDISARNVAKQYNTWMALEDLTKSINDDLNKGEAYRKHALPHP